MLFKNRIQAGKQLAEKFSAYKKKKDVIILGFPRGGVEVPFSVAKATSTPPLGIPSTMTSFLFLYAESFSANCFPA